MWLARAACDSPIDVAFLAAAATYTITDRFPHILDAAMGLLQAIVLAVVQGLTEFLPISSTAHMSIVSELAGWGHPGTAFEAVIQMGTLAAVLTYFWRDIVRILLAMVADLRQGRLITTHDAKLGWMIAVGTLPVVVCGLLFERQIDTSLQSLYVMAAALAGVALLLGAAEFALRAGRMGGHATRDVGQSTWRDAIVVGCAGVRPDPGHLPLRCDDSGRLGVWTESRSSGPLLILTVDSGRAVVGHLQAR